MPWLIITLEALAWLIRLVMLLVILRRRLPPSARLAWLSVIFFAPMLGLALYLLFGDIRTGRQRQRAQRRRRERIEGLDQTSGTPGQPQVPPWTGFVLNAEQPTAVRLQAEALGGFPVVGNNDVELITETAPFIDRLTADIEAASDHVHLLFYIFEPDDTGHRVARALEEAAQRGVACRLLADAAGSHHLFGSDLLRRLRQRGIQVAASQPFRPISRPLVRLDVRNHRKIVLIDGQVAYTGSTNVIHPNYGGKPGGPWHDLIGRFTGPIAGQFQSVFAEDWAVETGEALSGPAFYPPAQAVGDIPAQLVPSGPGQPKSNMLKVVLTAINAARRRIVLTTPYTVPNEATLLALAMAIDRGVEVIAVVPRGSDQWLVGAASEYYYDRLLEMGVRIYRHEHGLLHAKTMTVDEDFALLGSSNLDTRSYYLNFEVNALLYGPRITQRLGIAQWSYIQNAHPLNLRSWREQPVIRRYTNAAAALLAPLL